MADSTVAVTAGSGTNLLTWDNGAAAKTQYVRELPADTPQTPTTWTVSTTASTSVVAASDARIGMLMVNGSTGRVYIRFDTTAPTASLFGWYLESGERWEVPAAWVTRAVSLLGVSGASGTFYIQTGSRT